MCAIKKLQIRYPHSEETKERIRIGNLNRIVSKETKTKLRNHNLGKKASQETKDKMSLSHKLRHKNK